MERERVLVLACVNPQDLVLQNCKSKVVYEHQGVYNCIPANEEDSWTAETTAILRHWLTQSESVWFVRLDKDSGLVFFKDQQDRIINCREMLVELKMARKFSFSFQAVERMRLKKLMVDWVELHELKIDYAEFKNISAKRVDKPEPLPDTPSPKRIKEDVPDSVSPERLSKPPVAEEDGEQMAVDEDEDEQISPMEALMRALEQELNSVKEEKQKPVIALSQQNSYKFYGGKDPVFIYSKEHVEPYQSMDEVPYPVPLKQRIPGDNLSFQFQVWSRIENGGSAIVIEPLVDKKFVFEPVVFNYVFSKITSKQGRSKPWAIVIVDTRSAAENLVNYFDLLNKDFTTQVRVKTLLDGHGLDPEDIERELRCDVLILTLPMMMTLKYKRIDGFELNTVQMLVFQNVHNMNAADLQDVFVYMHPMHKKQIIATSLSWRPAFKKLFTDMQMPMICFGSPVEVAFKEKIAMAIKLAQDEEEQLKQLMEIVKQSVAEKRRIGVVCQTSETMQSIQLVFQRNSLECYALGDTPNESQLLLMTDKHLRNMIVDTVDVLVHFSMPKWNTFSRRFLLFETHFINKSPTQTHILLNIQEYEKFLPDMERLLARSSLSGTEELTKMFCKLKESAESLPTNAKALFCENIPICGDCPHPFSCSKRHTLNETDVPDGRLPASGQTVEFKLVSIISPNHFLVEIVPPKNRREQWQRSQLEVKLGLDLHFSEEENRVAKTELIVGDLCVIHQGRYRRARICSIAKSGQLTKSILVHVQCLETGNKFMLKQGFDDIYEMPEEFRGQVPQVFDAYLLGIRPVEVESGWCPASAYMLKTHLRFMEEEEEEDRFCAKGAVAFILGNQIYMKTLRVFEVLSCGVPIVVQDIKEWALDKCYALATPGKVFNAMQRRIEEFGLNDKIVVPLKEEVDEAENEEETAQSTPVQSDQIQDEKEEAMAEEQISTFAHKMTKDSEMPMNEVPIEVEEMWEDDNEDTFEYVAPDSFDEDEFDDNFDDDELVNILFGNLNLAGQQAAQPNYPCATIEEISEEEERPQVGAKQENVLPMLKASAKYPEIYWSQSEEEIKLRVAATDVVDYDLEVDANCIEFCLSFAEEEIRGGAMNLFGAIDPDTTKVELRGLAIIVTMTKVLQGVQFQWPRLLESKQQARWLKYYHRFDEVDKEELDEDRYEIIGPEEDTSDCFGDSHADLKYLENLP